MGIIKSPVMKGNAALSNGIWKYASLGLYNEEGYAIDGKSWWASVSLNSKWIVNKIWWKNGFQNGNVKKFTFQAAVEDVKDPDWIDLLVCDNVGADINYVEPEMKEYEIANDVGYHLYRFVVDEVYNVNRMKNLLIYTVIEEIQLEKQDEYNIMFHESGGNRNSLPSNDIKMQGVDFKIKEIRPTKFENYFLGWSVDRKIINNETGIENLYKVDYKPGDVYKGDADLNLYAVWKGMKYLLPIARFRDGSYASLTGKPCGNGIPCFHSNDVGIIWNSQQCEAFARYAYYLATGKQFNRGYERLDTYNANGIELNENNLYSHLQKWVRIRM